MPNTLTLTMATCEGRLAPTEVQKAMIHNFILGQDEKPVQVKFSKPHQVRSLKQNSFLWSCVYPVISESIGHTTEEVHYIFRDMLLPRKFLKIGNKEIEARKTTTDLTPSEFGQYIEKIVAYCAQELGLVIPLPNKP